MTQGRRQLPKSGGAEFPMLLDSNRRAHFYEGSKYAQLIYLGMHIYTIFKVQLPNYLSTPNLDYMLLFLQLTMLCV